MDTQLAVSRRERLINAKESREDEIPKSFEMHDYISIEELARKLKISRWWLYHQISGKRLPFPLYKIGRKVRFRISEVNSWIEARKIDNNA